MHRMQMSRQQPGPARVCPLSGVFLRQTKRIKPSSINTAASSPLSGTHPCDHALLCSLNVRLHTESQRGVFSRRNPDGVPVQASCKRDPATCMPQTMFSTTLKPPRQRYHSIHSCHLDHFLSQVLYDPASPPVQRPSRRRWFSKGPQLVERLPEKRSEAPIRLLDS